MSTQVQSKRSTVTTVTVLMGTFVSSIVLSSIVGDKLSLYLDRCAPALVQIITIGSNVMDSQIHSSHENMLQFTAANFL